MRVGRGSAAHPTAVWRALLMAVAWLGAYPLAGSARPIPPPQEAKTEAAPAPALTLATTYHPQLPLAHYWVSEKYDGVRAYWDGTQLRTRQGLPIHAPAWFTAGWPTTPFEGELWAGRGKFAAAQSAAAQTTPSDATWRPLRLMVFDLPAHPGPFTERLQVMQAVVQKINQPWVVAAPQWRVSNHAQLQQQLARYTQDGAEGLMLRHAQAPYRGGRSSDLVKVKTWQDAEAVVIAHLPGQGKYTGLTGALQVRLPDGQVMRLGSGLRDADRRHPPPIGSTITYRYQGTHASGLPRFARLWRWHSTPASQPDAVPQPLPPEGDSLLRP